MFNQTFKNGYSILQRRNSIKSALGEKISSVSRPTDKLLCIRMSIQFSVRTQGPSVDLELDILASAKLFHASINCAEISIG